MHLLAYSGQAMSKPASAFLTGRLRLPFNAPRGPQIFILHLISRLKLINASSSLAMHI